MARSKTLRRESIAFFLVSSGFFKGQTGERKKKRRGKDLGGKKKRHKTMLVDGQKER